MENYTKVATLDNSDPGQKVVTEMKKTTKLEDVEETLGVVNELLDGGETSFLSRDPRGVVVSSFLHLTLLDTAVDYSVGVDSFSFVENLRERRRGETWARVVSCMEDVTGKGTDAGLAVFV